MVVDEAQ